MTELKVFLAMLERVGIGHGTRTDYNPPGTGVLIEHPDDDGDGWWQTEWQFNDKGELVDVCHYRGEVG